MSHINARHHIIRELLAELVELVLKEVTHADDRHFGMHRCQVLARVFPFRVCCYIQIDTQFTQEVPNGTAHRFVMRALGNGRSAVPRHESLHLLDTSIEQFDARIR